MFRDCLRFLDKRITFRRRSVQRQRYNTPLVVPENARRSSVTLTGRRSFRRKTRPFPGVSAGYDRSVPAQTGVAVIGSGGLLVRSVVDSPSPLPLQPLLPLRTRSCSRSGPHLHSGFHCHSCSRARPAPVGVRHGSRPTGSSVSHPQFDASTEVAGRSWRRAPVIVLRARADSTSSSVPVIPHDRSSDLVTIRWSSDGRPDRSRATAVALAPGATDRLGRLR